MILFTVTLCANPANDLTCPPHELSFKTAELQSADFSAAGGSSPNDIEAIKHWSARTLEQLKAEEQLLDAQVSALKIRFAEKVAPLVERTKASTAKGGECFKTTLLHFMRVLLTVI